MSQDEIFYCTECGDKLYLKNERTKKQPDGSLCTFVDGGCINESCPEKGNYGRIDLKKRVKIS
jgi:hypothetical protein